MTQQTIRWPALERLTMDTPAGEAIAAEAQLQGARRVFLLVSRHLDTQTTEIEKVRRCLGSRYAGSHNGIRPHVPRADVLQAASAARAAHADLLVTIGGGSVTDAGKVVLICLKHEITALEQLDAFRINYRQDGSVIPGSYAGPDVRAVCVPTTLSGGEFNSLAGVTNEVLQRKQGYEHKHLVPTLIVLDPALSVHTPDWLWTSTGVRALDHAVETLASYHSNEFCDGIADSALRLLAEGLPRVRSNPADLDARLKCQVGAAQSMIPMVCGVPMGASHAIGHVLGAVCNVPHGYTSCVMTPYVQSWNAEVGAPRQRRISACLGDANTPSGLLLDRLISSLGMPRTLDAVGVGPEHFQSIAEGTLQDIWGGTNPRPIRSAEDVITLLRRALHGQRNNQGVADG